MQTQTMNSLRLTATDPDLRAGFFALKTRRDVADLLEVDYPRLVYHLYVFPKDQRYTNFTIPKKSGGVRTITAPVSSLKIVQRKLNQVLQAVYRPRHSVHGFTRDRSVLSNARQHCRQRYVFNLDLKDFFPSINFGRVRGLFMAKPYNLPAEAATALAQICCFENQLPQGAPTSPVLSNMVCSKMDGALQRLAKRYRCYYTRYVDDITFSTSLPYFPNQLGERLARDAQGSAKIGNDLNEQIIGNGFVVNQAKVRLRTRGRRQEVTGLTTNVFPNVRRKFVNQIRAMLHAWETYGLDAAQEDHFKKPNQKHRYPAGKQPPFQYIVKGKIEYLGMIRGSSDPVFQALLADLHSICPELVPEHRLITQPISLVVMTEGPTDPKHLRKSLESLQGNGLFQNLEIEFQDFSKESRSGSGDLKQFCNQAPRAKPARPTIAIFDRDEPAILKDVTDPDSPFKKWGNNVFSFAIPVPTHRAATPNVCIELYYKDEEIMRHNSDGRRLFLSNEFDRDSARHVTEDLNCTDRNKIRNADLLKIIDDGVFNSANENVALTKNAFADLISTNAQGFDDFDFDEFSKIFDVISAIAEEGTIAGN